MNKKYLTTLIVILLAGGITLTVINCNGNNGSSSGGDSTNGTRPVVPAPLNFQIQGKPYPHDTSFYTEGFLIYKGFLYESTGLYGQSKLLKTNIADLATGGPTTSIKLDAKYFGEGITILRDTIYQLTYQEKTAFVYTMDLKKIKEFHYDLKEGWGMTTDGTYLIIGDGSSNLYFYDPSTFKEVKRLQVTDSGSPSFNINELEFIDGYIYANQWQLPYLLKIDPATGIIVAKGDVTEVWDRIKQKDPHAEVPNGIAYDSNTKKIYITGKNWPELYEIVFQ
jgi:glutamine cyclotransferase